MSFAGKVVIATGASSGIGAATAVLFAKEGADVAIVARTQAKLDAVAAKTRALGRKALVLRADLSKEEEAAVIVPRTVKQFGKLDVLAHFDAWSFKNIEEIKKSLVDSVALDYVAKDDEIGDVILFVASDKARSVTGIDNGYLLKH